MRALRSYGVYAGAASLSAAVVAFAGAYTAGEPTSAVLAAILIATTTAFFATLTVLSVVGRGRNRVVRGDGKQKSKSGHDRAD
jgi:hypothetical protein